MSTEPITAIDVWSDLYRLLLEQYKLPRADGQPGRVSGIIQLMAEELQLIEQALQELLPILDLTYASGVLLDNIGKIAMVSRGSMNDVAYRIALQAAFQRVDSGTPEQIIASVKAVTKSTKVWYIPEYPAGYWIIYDGHGLTREFLERVSPAGVLAMPGCYLADAHGDLIRTATGEPILVVGPCEDDPFPEDNVWDGGKGSIDPTDFKLKTAWPFKSGDGVGTYPDGGKGAIDPTDYTFTDGTYAENP